MGLTGWARIMGGTADWFPRGVPRTRRSWRHVCTYLRRLAVLLLTAAPSLGLSVAVRCPYSGLAVAGCCSSSGVASGVSRPRPDLDVVHRPVLRSAFCPQPRVPRTTYATAGRGRGRGLSGVENYLPRRTRHRQSWLEHVSSRHLPTPSSVSSSQEFFSVGHPHAGLDIWPCRLLVELQPSCHPSS